MADRLNDTDPQSPLARVSRTDPGLGSSPPVAAVAAATAEAAEASEVSPLPPAAPTPTPTPTPGSASIEALLDGIAGPRPPSSRRGGAAPDSARAYVPARAVPASQPMPPREPALVVTPEPPPSSGGPGAGHANGEASEPRRAAELEPTRPVMRRPPEERTFRRHKEERTVYTGRRALIRNATVVILSASVVAVMMMSIMRWREAHRPRQASAVVVMPAEPEPGAPAVAPENAPEAPAAVIASAVPGAAQEQAPAPPTRASGGGTSGVVASGAKPAGAAPRRAKAETKPAAPADGALDDLNRQIRH